jgi:hypothetical protein
MESSGAGSNKMDPRESDPRLFTVLDPDQFVRDLKELDPQKKDPLPCNIMCVAVTFDIISCSMFYSA